MKIALGLPFSCFILLFWVNSATAQVVPESWVVTEKATGRSDTLRLGTQLRVDVDETGTTARYIRPLFFWHADTLALGASGRRPQVFLPVKSVRSVSWRLPEKPLARKQRIGGGIALAAGLAMMLSGAVIDFNDNFCIDLGGGGCGPSNPRGGALAAVGAAAGITGVVIMFSSRGQMRRVKNPASGWVVSPLQTGQ